MKFLHLSDIHFRRRYDTDTFTAAYFSEPNFPEKQLEILCQTIDIKEYDFVLITGDLVHEGDVEDYIELKRLLSECFQEIPYFFCRGNHDIRHNFLQGMAVAANEEGDYIHCQYINGLRVISLDSAEENDHEGTISLMQYEQLERYLQAPAEKGSILLMHHPLAWEEEHIATKVPNGFYELIEKSDIIGIFVGHIHQSSTLTYASKMQYMSEAIAFGVDEYPDKSIFTNRTGYSVYRMTDHGLYGYHHLLTPKQTVTGGITKPIVSTE